jgi:hypothetical protein
VPTIISSDRPDDLRTEDVPVPTIISSDRPDDLRSENIPEFCIDAGSTGNIARFINHSCEPNLFVQCVLSSHHDIKLARVMLFAADNIPPLQVILSPSVRLRTLELFFIYLFILFVNYWVYLFWL